MTCRSLEPQSQTQEKLLRGEPLKDAAAMKEFVSLVTAADGGGLAAVLLKCRDGGTMTPLQEYRSELAGGREAGGVGTVRPAPEVARTSG